MQKAYEVLKDVFGYDEFRLQQRNAIENILEGKDTFVLMPTGGGKSLCYQVPALCLDGVTIVISPLISLMKNQVDALKINGISAEYLNSTLDMDRWNEIYNDVLDQKIKLLYLSPEGLTSARVQKLIKQSNISLVAVDEAHCVSQWGHEFRSDYMNLGSLRDILPEVPFIALTATADVRVRKDIERNLRLKNHGEFLSSFDRANIRYEIYPKDNGMQQLQDFLKSQRGNTGIVYCGTRSRVDQVCEKLNEKGYNAHAYHAGLSDEHRSETQERFEKEDDIIVVATIAFGMGIDKPNVRFVAHMGLPKNIESYYQETGRAGRDGEDAVAWMVFGLDDLVRNKRFLENSDAQGAYKEIASSKIDAMLSFSELITCRRRYLLNYFNEEYPQDCGNCDCCLSEFEKFDATIEAKKFLSTVFRTNQMYGAKYIIDILRESKDEKIFQRGHQELSVYGIGKDTPAKEWNFIVRNLIFRDILQYKNLEYRTLGLGKNAVKVLKEGEPFLLNRALKKVGVAKKKVSTEVTNTELYERLVEKRRSLAEKLEIAPYMIFSNKALVSMSDLLPKNDAEFLDVHGVGQKKCDEFAQEFLPVISNYL